MVVMAILLNEKTVQCVFMWFKFHNAYNLAKLHQLPSCIYLLLVISVQLTSG